MNFGVDNNWYSSFNSTDHIYFSMVFWILRVFFFRVRTHLNFGKNNLMKTLFGKYNLGATLHILIIFGHTCFDLIFQTQNLYSYYNIREKILLQQTSYDGYVSLQQMYKSNLYLCKTCFWTNKNITFIRYNFLFGQFRRKGDNFYARKIFFCA